MEHWNMFTYAINTNKIEEATELAKAVTPIEEWIHYYHFFGKYIDLCCDKSFYSNDMFNIFLDPIYLPVYIKGMITHIIQKPLKLIKIFCDSFNDYIKPIENITAQIDDLDKIHYLHNRYPNLINYEHLFIFVIKNGHVDVFNFLKTFVILEDEIFTDIVTKMKYHFLQSMLRKNNINLEIDYYGFMLNKNCRYTLNIDIFIDMFNMDRLQWLHMDLCLMALKFDPNVLYMIYIRGLLHLVSIPILNACLDAKKNENCLFINNIIKDELQNREH